MMARANVNATPGAILFGHLFLLFLVQWKLSSGLPLSGDCDGSQNDWTLQGEFVIRAGSGKARLVKNETEWLKKTEHYLKVDESCDHEPPSICQGNLQATKVKSEASRFRLLVTPRTDAISLWQLNDVAFQYNTSSLFLYPDTVGDGEYLQLRDAAHAGAARGPFFFRLQQYRRCNRFAFKLKENETEEALTAGPKKPKKEKYSEMKKRQAFMLERPETNGAPLTVGPAHCNCSQ